MWLIFCFVFLSSDGSKPSKRQWFSNSNLVLQQWSQITAPEPVDRQLTTPDWSQVRGHQLRKDSGQTVYLKQKPTAERHILDVENQTAFPSKNWILFLWTYFSATDAQQCWLRSQLIVCRSCGSKVKSRSMCVEVSQNSCQKYLKPSEIQGSLGFIFGFFLFCFFTAHGWRSYFCVKQVLQNWPPSFEHVAIGHTL